MINLVPPTVDNVTPVHQLLARNHKIRRERMAMAARKSRVIDPEEKRATKDVRAPEDDEVHSNTPLYRGVDRAKLARIKADYFAGIPIKAIIINHQISTKIFDSIRAKYQWPPAKVVNPAKLEKHRRMEKANKVAADYMRAVGDPNVTCRYAGGGWFRVEGYGYSNGFRAGELDPNFQPWKRRR